MERIILTLLIGAFLFFLGVLIHRNSNIIGIHDSHAKSKDKILFIRNITYPMMFLGLFGAVISVMSIVFSWFIDFYIVASMGILLPTSVLLLNKRYFTRASTLLFGLIVLFVAMMSVGIYYSEREAVIKICRNRVKISSIYGIAINGAEIKNARLLDTLPPIEERVNGYARRDIMKGHFRLKSWGETKLFLQSSDPPFLIIDTYESYKIVINSKEKGKTEDYYIKIKQLKHH